MAHAGELPDPFPDIAASYLVKINGKDTWSHKPDARLAPASLTKILTALLVIEKVDLSETVIIKSSVLKETGTRIGLKPGDRLRVVDLLAATVLQSANDSCLALAEHAGGSKKTFVSLMNSRAHEMGMRHTRFTNPCGHDEDGLYSTASDLAILAEYAMKNVTFSALASLIKGKISTIDGRRTFMIENKNELIGRYNGAKGVKTGFTGKAGKCLIAFADRSGVQVLLVLLNAPDRWWDAVKMLDAAFKYSASHTVHPE